MDSGDTAWVLVSTVLVFLMIPGLAMFYGGLVRQQNVAATMLQCLVAAAIGGVVWGAIGYTLAFGDTALGWGALGSPAQHPFLRGVGLEARGSIPHLVFMLFQGIFAAITPALIVGAYAERMRFGKAVSFTLIWCLLVYAPVAHWVWGPRGWLAELGAIDFAGGTVVHLASGAAGLAVAKVLGVRNNGAKEPHNLVMVAAGAGLLWVGWFGFNAGSALGANASAGLALANTFFGGAGGLLAWALVDSKLANRPPQLLAAANGALAGLVCVTPAAGYVAPGSALAIGLLGGAVCSAAVKWKARLGVDDALDAFGIHGVGGALGAILTGVFASAAWGAPSGGGPALIGKQLLAVAAVGGYSFGVTWLLASWLDLARPSWNVVQRGELRVEAFDEEHGLDQAQGESGYDWNR